MQSEGEAWKVAGKGSRKSPGLTLYAGDTIRFGRTSYKVISQRSRLSSANLLDTTMISDEVDLDPAPRKSQCTCRICLSEEEREDNLLISPCKCDGSVKYIHMRCLQEWMRSKSEVKTKGFITRCIIYQLQCELCKTLIPDRIYTQGRTVELSAYLRPDAPHLVLEEDGTLEDSNRILYILSLPEGKVLKVGRGRECDIRIRDFAVSRVNSYLKFSDQQFTVEDRGSKFGSLVQLTHPLPLDRLPLSLQVNKTLVTIAEVRQGWLCGLCCCFSREGEGKDKTEGAVERRKDRMATRVAPFEPTESESYGNFRSCVINT